MLGLKKSFQKKAQMSTGAELLPSSVAHLQLPKSACDLARKGRLHQTWIKNHAIRGVIAPHSFQLYKPRHFTVICKVYRLGW